MPTPNLPHDVIEEILPWLPVKSLLRFKSVSKPWKTLISDPSFTKMHSERSALSRTNYILTSTPRGLNLVGHETCLGDEVRRLDFPPKNGGGVRIMGSCNGLVALNVNNDEDFFLWNPSTGDYKMLPHPWPGFVNNPYIWTGFGYDSSTDDYKLFVGKRWRVLISDGHDGWPGECQLKRSASISSVRSNSWRVIQTPMHCYRNFSGIFLNGALHWRLDDTWSTEERIKALDLKNERLGIVEWPDFAGIHDCDEVGVLGDRLCLTLYTSLDPPYFYPAVEIWVMKEYGVKGSWTKLLNLPPDRIYYQLQPLCISKGNQLISFNDKDEEKELIRYDAKKTIISEKFKIYECDYSLLLQHKHLCQAIMCAESLYFPLM